MFSMQVICGNRLKCWNTMPVSPFRSISPEVIVLSPLIQRSSELLPEPDGPIMATISPLCIEKSTLFTALKPE